MIKLILFLLVVLLVVLFDWLNNKYELNPTKLLVIFRLITAFIFSATLVCLVISMFSEHVGAGVLI
jgi:hypothetical protein